MDNRSEKAWNTVNINMWFWGSSEIQNPSTDADKEACADQASEGDQVLRMELTVKFVTLCNELGYILPVPWDFVKWLVLK